MTMCIKIEGLSTYRRYERLAATIKSWREDLKQGG